MRWIDMILHHLRSIFRRGVIDRELDDELRYHLDRQIEAYRAAGLTYDVARQTALREFGGMARTKEYCRDVDHNIWLDGMLQDVRFGIRAFRKRPGFTVCALIVISLGVGSATAVFSVVNRVLLTPLPYLQPERLVRVFGVWEHGSREGVSPPDFIDYRQQNTLFESVGAAGNTTPLLNLKGVGEPEQIGSRSITAGFFQTLGTPMLFGREFVPEEEAWQGPKVAILSYGLWQREFGGDRAIVGGPLSINGVPYTVVGILPPLYDFLGPTELFTPMQPNPVPEMRGVRTLIMIARLKNGVDLKGGQGELDVLSGRLEGQYSKFDHGWSVKAVPLTDEVTKDVKLALLMLLGAVGLIVLLVSANVASLMLSQTASRRAELSIRASLGAGRARLARQLITESLMLALAGGSLGCALGYGGLLFIRRFGPSTIPRVAEVSMDLRVFSFALILSVTIGVLFGLEPAWRAGGLDLALAIKGAGRTLSARLGLREILVAAQVTISIVLLIAAGLLTRTLLRLESVNPGFQPAGILTTRIALASSKYSDGTGAKLSAFWREAVDRLEAVPGISGAALTSELPLTGLNNPSPRVATATDGKSYLLYLRSVSPDYWNVMQIPLLSGRFLTAADRKSMPRVVVINEQFGRDVFGDENPIGQRLTFNFQERFEKEDYQAVVVGVVGSVHHTSLAAPPFREAYLPLEQSPLFNYDVVVRTRIEPMAIAGSLREAIWSIDPDQAVGPLRTVNEVVDLGLTQPRFRGYLLAVFAAFALVLAGAGLYGLLSFLVSQRSREIGIRIALGASRRNILAMIMGKGVALTAVGLLLGSLMSLLLVRLLSSLVFGIGLADPITFVAAVATLLPVALIASYIPARRATRLDPAEALRSE